MVLCQLSLMCRERVFLLSVYNEATAAYAKAVMTLHERIGTSSKSEYEILLKAVNIARTKAEQARLELEEHMSEHTCEENGFAMHT